jgi:hypothetical protein
MNLILFWFLFFTIITVIPLTIFSVNYFINIPADRFSQEFKEYTFSKLMQIPRYTIIHDEVEVNEIIFGDFTENIESEEESKNNEVLNEVKSPKVVESVPKKTSPLKKYQDSKKTYDENIEKFDVKDDSQIKITKPNFTDFDVVEGYRSFEETITVGRESKLYIESCLERFFRVQPRFRGKIIVKFDVHWDGHIIPETLKIVYSDIEYEPIKECIKKNILRWVTYPEVPKEQGIYSVTQKYIF